MHALLDTSSFLWFIGGSEKLSRRGREFMLDSDNELFLSTASLWEIAINVSIGKLELLQPFGELIPKQLQNNEIGVMPIRFEHLSAMIDLPFHHRDPFDRLINAQGVKENLPVITNDSMFQKYAVDILW